MIIHSQPDFDDLEEQGKGVIQKRAIALAMHSIGPLEKIRQAYLKDVAAQTRGSYRVKKANRHGLSFARLLNVWPDPSQSNQSPISSRGRKRD